MFSICSLVDAAAAHLSLPRLTSAPVIEEFLLGEPVTGMARVSGFVQNQPYDGDPASRDTVTFLGYDDEHFYVVFMAYDDGDKIRARLSPRENVWSEQRAVAIEVLVSDAALGVESRALSQAH